MNSKKWSVYFFITVFALLSVIGVTILYVDPFFHFHKPLDNVAYQLDRSDQRYINDGITRHFDYSAVITGSSMTENFKASEADRLFGVKTIKIPFVGAAFKETDEAVARALERNKDVKIVVRSLDLTRIENHKDTLRYDEKSYPTYLYDGNPFNDANYFLNKDVLLGSTANAMYYTLLGKEMTTFDSYSNSINQRSTGKTAVLKSYYRTSPKEATKYMDDKTYNTVRDNINQNFIQRAKENPQVKFYCFFPPYSLLYFDNLKQKGELDRHKQSLLLATKMLTEVDNIEVYGFFEDYETVTDLNKYTDWLHYTDDMNSHILESMAKGEHRLTKDNYEVYWNKVFDFYGNYDYTPVVK